MSSNRWSSLIAVYVTLSCASLAGCATEVSRTPTQFTPGTVARNQFIVVTREVTVTPSSGYSLTLKAGSTWKYVGQVPEGAVYKIQNDVFLLEGRNMHEAYCVIDNDELVGFFLAAEQAFSPLTPHVPLPINER